ncbi:MAG TPA: AfsR/SARP family transcriptional regulator [Streptosporangiaceae bacterium]|nr:AfsR/SARP family transcriptional regulator [Streptosporangiaceae bacterium]
MISDRDVVLRLLGPVRVRTGGLWLVPVTAQLRLVVGIMAVRGGQVVSVDELIEAIWDSRPPRSARGSLQSLMTRVRHLLEPVPGAALTRCGDGYRMEVDTDRIDVGRFRSLARSARAAEGPDAIGRFESALAQWTGPVLADAVSTTRAGAIRQALDAELTSVIQDRFRCMLTCGRLRDAAAELPAAVTRLPLNECLAAMLMETLYRSGQRADALRAFRRMRGRLAEQLGVEPGPELQSLHQRILSGDAGLARSVTAAERVSVKLPVVVPRQSPAAPAPLVGRLEKAAILTRLGDTYRADGDHEHARAAWQQALVILDELHDLSSREVRSRLTS